jgi:hypothetical protein
MFRQDRTFDVRDYSRPEDRDGDEYSVLASNVTHDEARQVVKDYKGDASQVSVHEHIPVFWSACIALVERHYGGPEEGGWWYDSVTVDDPEAMLLTSEAGGPWVSKSEDFISRIATLVSKIIDDEKLNDVAAYEGAQYRVEIFEGYPRNYPTHKPHYE